MYKAAFEPVIPRENRLVPILVYNDYYKVTEYEVKAMDFTESPGDIEMEDNLEGGEERVLNEEFDTATDTDLVEVEEGSFDDEEEELTTKEKGKAADLHSLEVRRAIEEHAEKMKLRKELDYLFDDEFGNEEDDGEAG